MKITGKVEGAGKIAYAILIILSAAIPALLSACGDAHPAETERSDVVFYLSFASDRHENTEAIYNVMKNMPEDVSFVGLIGDMVGKDERYDTSEVLDEVLSVFPSLGADCVDIIYGGHDEDANDDCGILKCKDASSLIYAGYNDSGYSDSGYEDSNYNDSGYDDTGYDDSGYGDGNYNDSGYDDTGYDGTSYNGSGDVAYYVYGISYDSMTNPSVASAEASDFERWIDTVSDCSIPIIVLSHVPIHAKRGDNHGASYWNAALNYAATGSESGSKSGSKSGSESEIESDGGSGSGSESGGGSESESGSGSGTEVIRDVIFLSGHNHTVDPEEYYYSPGSTISVPDTSGDGENSSDIYYTYITAGYLNDNESATLIKIESDKITFTKYSAESSFTLGVVSRACSG